MYDYKISAKDMEAMSRDNQEEWFKKIGLGGLSLEERALIIALDVKAEQDNKN